MLGIGMRAGARGSGEVVEILRWFGTFSRELG